MARRRSSSSTSSSSSSSSPDDARKPAAKPAAPASSDSVDRIWASFKKLVFLGALLAILLNIQASKQLKERFATDHHHDLEEFMKPLDLGGSSLASGAGGQANTPNAITIKAKPPNKVLRILQLLERQEKTLRPPDGLRRVVVLGKSFILKRDFSIWEMTYGELGFQVTSTTKQELTHEGPDSWSVMLCLDLFDGKSHCIEPSDLPSMRRWQRISRLIGLRKILWNKDRFCETMGAALKGFNNYTEFVFPCWILPGQFNDMIAEVQERFRDARFILKPTDRGEGNGIIVMDSYRKLANWKAEFPDNEEVVVQTYLNDPMLIKDRKWDMRTYVLITSIHPLRLYMYRDGLVRFATTKYDKDAKDGGKKTAFLTNTSVNKKTGQSVEDLTWPYPQVYEYLKKHDKIDPDILWKRIERAVTQVIMSSESAFLRRFKALRNDYTCANCFQLLGVDVIVDANIVPRVIEVNGEPSMQLSGELNSHYDHTKKSMTHDLVQILFTTDSYARELTAMLYDLELDGWNIGYLSLGGCATTDDMCLRTIDLQYLLDFVKEEYNMGGFRRLYPTPDGDYYTRFLTHLESKLPYGTLTSTLRLHKLVTTLARRSRIKQNNQIADPKFANSAEAAAMSSSGGGDEEQSSSRHGSESASSKDEGGDVEAEED